MHERDRGEHQVGTPARSDASNAAVNQPVDVSFRHRVHFGTDFLDVTDRSLAACIETDQDHDGPARCIVVADAGLTRHWTRLEDEVRRYAEAHATAMEIVAPMLVVDGGEASKNDWSVVEQVTRLIESASICRQSYVIVFGGGAVLDAVGFGASIAHRGVRLVRFPTTTLSQDDSGVGVKNGINAFGKKNFLGSFGVPWAVLNDARFLETQSDRDCRSGLSEAVKVALLKDASLFDFIAEHAEQLTARQPDALTEVIRRSALLHLDHIVSGGDPFEQAAARPLDFGHWAAHKLEQVTQYDLRHGEAVAIGLAIDVVYSALSDRLDWDDAERILRTLERLGFELHHARMDDVDILLEGLSEFREHLGGTLTITLLEGIGVPVDVHTMDAGLVRRSIEFLAQRSESDARRKHAG